MVPQQQIQMNRHPHIHWLQSSHSDPTTHVHDCLSNCCSMMLFIPFSLKPLFIWTIQLHFSNNCCSMMLFILFSLKARFIWTIRLHFPNISHQRFRCILLVTSSYVLCLHKIFWKILQIPIWHPFKYRSCFPCRQALSFQ